MIITDINFQKLKSEYYRYLPDLVTLQRDFGGPSVYFHQQTLIECNQSFLSNRHIEMIYATLTSWGMHRMGETKTKMVEFLDFKKSIDSVAPVLKELQFLKLEQFASEPTDIFSIVKEICFKLRVSVSNSKIVGNSKALAHIIPNLVPPIDRQYSIRFFVQTLSNFKDIEEEQKFYAYIIKRCYEFIQIIKDDSRVVIDKQFNSSFPKVFDNLLMLYLKRSKNGA